MIRAYSPHQCYAWAVCSAARNAAGVSWRTCMNTEKDAAIDRVREVRHRISAQFGHDTKRLIDHYIELQKKYADRLVKPARQPEPADVVTSK